MPGAVVPVLLGGVPLRAVHGSQACPARRLRPRAAGGAWPAAEEAQRESLPLGPNLGGLPGSALLAPLDASGATPSSATAASWGGGGAPVPIKSLVFLADGAPLVVVLPMEGRVAEGKLASILALPRSKLQLAPAGAVEGLCGFPVGSVPPLGHPRPLRTLVDVRLTRAPHVATLAGAAGLMEVAELLRLSGAQVADLCRPGPGEEALALSSGPVGAAGAGEAAAAVEAGAPPPPPPPWAPGSVVVALEGVVAQKRKVARLLCFLSLAPPPAVGTQPGGLLRRQWAHPGPAAGGGGLCEVQLILGKTLADRLGREAASALLKALKLGQRVRVVGRPQPGVPGGAHSARSVLDVVVDDISIVAAPPPRTAAGRRGGRSTDRQQRRGGGKGGGEGPFYELPLPPEAIELVDDLAGVRRMAAALFGGGRSGDGLLASAAEGAAEVDAAAGSPAAVVGLDCEWQPFGRGECATPVSLIQVSTPTRVYLVDLLTLLPAPTNASSSSSSSTMPAAAGDRAPHAEGDTAAEELAVSVAAEPEPLSPAGAALSAALARLFGEASIVKAGFGLAHDLSRLAESYPHLPCFGGAGGTTAVPLCSHVDLILLAKAALLPALLGGGKSAAPHVVGLSSLVEAVLGAPLDKAQQCSDWQARPLSGAQAGYAGLDAYCLVELYRTLLPRCPGSDALLAEGHLSGGVDSVTAYHPANREPSARRGRRRLLRADQLASGNTVPPDPRYLAALARRREREGPPSLAASGAADEGSTFGQRCNTAHLMSSYLGQAMPGGGGRTAVVTAAATDDSGTEPPRPPRHPRGSGVVEWSNAAMLFINISAAGSTPQRYPNVFGRLPAAGGGGLTIGWWPGRGQSLRHPAVQRMLGPLPEGGGSDASSSPAAVDVLLFCRPARGGEYVFCGRLRPAAVADDSGGQAAITWELVDSPALLARPAFQALLALQGG